jgi:SAM-dependent methyltransferase
LRVLYKVGAAKGVPVGNKKKSWDVLKTFQFLEANVGKETPILDLGAYSSEILCILHGQGFSDLTGIDLSPKVCEMPHTDVVKYVSGDFTVTIFPPDAFGAITAISVLEHGFNGPKVLKEVSRILKPGGYFVGSIDYWPEKIDTTGITAYGVDWNIFSKDEILRFVEEARKHRLVPVGKVSLEASERTVSWFDKRYTFAWFAFNKVD